MIQKVIMAGTDRRAGVRVTVKKGVRVREHRGAARGGAPRRVRKNMDMDQRKLRAAQRALGAATETETVDRALDLVLGRARFDAALDRIAERGGFHDYRAPR